jgi:uncharacterized protein YyaL (SSP411 family)
MALYDEFAPQPNRLIDAQSAYLRSAAYQPVGWYPYCPEAFTEARRQGKPVLLDIGAAWCHWCHVIDRESYENHEVATLINELFIPVKVDRDERPDIDARYQLAVQLLTGHGGWPLTVFLDADGVPFFGGTYIPPEDMLGRTGFMSLLPRIAHAYKHRRHELDEVAKSLQDRTRASALDAGRPGVLDEEAYRRVLRAVRARFNPDQGGFEHGGPKFPHPAAVELALLQHFLSGDDRWLVLVEKTLREMAWGGIYDQLGGGWHRYAVDATWTVPHFEKMAADNALLLENYVHAYRATGDALYREIAEGTLEYILRELADRQNGGFYASQDADVGLEDDGSYWTWTLAEITRALTPDEAAVLVPYFGVTPDGNVPDSNRNVLRVTAVPARIAADLQIDEEEVRKRIAAGKAKLLHARERRKIPAVDANKYAGWNALLISACIEAGTLLNRPDVTAFALRTADAMLYDAYDADQGFYHAFHLGIGARVPGLLEDQAYMAKALLDAFGAGGQRAHLDAACRLLDLCLERYWDDTAGGFFDTAAQGHDVEVPFLALRRKSIEDLPTPAPNAVLALALDRAALLTHEDRYRDAAGATLSAFAGQAPDYGPFAATFGLALGYHLYPPAAAIVVGPLEEEATQYLWQTALETYRPGRLAAAFAPNADPPYPPREPATAVAYVCAGVACTEPAADVETLRHNLLTFGKPEMREEE